MRRSRESRLARRQGHSRRLKQGQAVSFATRQRQKRAGRRLSLALIRQALVGGQVKSPQDLHKIIIAGLIVGLSTRIRETRNPARLAGKAARLAIDLAADTYLGWIDSKADERLGGEEAERLGFEERLQDTWGEGLRLVSLTRSVCLDIGMQYHQDHETADDLVHHALVKLHARACLIAAEILALMRAGHASGAHARWRALHEVTVIGSFLAAGDNDLSERYLLYEHVESLAAARDYQKNAVDLGYEPLTAAEMEDLEGTVNQLTEQYGKLYKKPYGWAAHIFAHAPKYQEIEEAADLGHYRSYYRLASHPVHAGPKSIMFDLGIRDPSRIMLAGPSDGGFADPGQGLCISLTQITAALIGRTEDAHAAAAMKVMLELSDRAGQALIKTHWEQEAKEDRREEEEQEEDEGTPRTSEAPPARKWGLGSA